MTEDTTFRIYSMTKPVIGAALMTLYEEGRFNLRDRVQRYIPELGGLPDRLGNAASRSMSRAT